MGKKSPRQYYDELSDLVFSEKGSSKRADKLFNILDGLGYPSDSIMNAIDSGNKLPNKEEFKKGGVIKKKKKLQEPRGRPPKEKRMLRGPEPKIIKKKTGGQIGKPRGWGAARHANN